MLVDYKYCLRSCIKDLFCFMLARRTCMIPRWGENGPDQPHKIAEQLVVLGAQLPEAAKKLRVASAQPATVSLWVA